ncbi:mannitol dehydrogenase family protein [Zobellia galactanivorans]|uniref:D-mannonate oxidoreductase n=1 Tax=Zobellia galactanivorans (strain DSM 12802 / CCUG 47099 / CIP 106680 / NCIMB 13871 / Dsij) TaxID=63186 RepID=G0KZI7_ZOBGA|nr:MULTISPECIES: mannitol dehydrogenase family protein [Zobellia]MDO6808788.1 mannitol dehydrogenase family protein [Zobellia galactanivorans]OWW25758.1 mannitol dehydrogenase [Zobellia sp. OII3]CAZ98398.1 D-mannonate oxidoreductase [Zobellia galactanivorans]
MKNYKLNSTNLSHISERVSVPKYNRSKLKTGIVHVGIGGFHRAHEAFYTDQLLQDESVTDWGICGVALLDFDTKIYNTLKEQDGLYTLIVKELDGTHTRQVIGSIVEYLFAPEAPIKVIEKMASPEVKIITLTITEGGYNYNEATKKFDFDNPLIQHDLTHPNSPKTIFGYLTQALKLRKDRGLKGCTIQSCDNIQGNGHMAKRMLLTYVSTAAPDLVEWIESHVSFPNAMVDRITPATSEADIINLRETTGIEDAWPVVCEPFKQWVIEDDFIEGRPAWETVGAQFVNNVEPYEKMKLSLLNAGHSVLGILGALLGYDTIDEAVNNPNVRSFLNSYMDVEVSPVLGDLEGIDLSDYKRSLLERFGNINIKDQIDRICSESSAKIPIFILPTVNAQLTENGPIKRAAFVIAAWAIYSLGKDEKGHVLNIKDAMASLISEKAKVAVENPKTFLEIESVFGKLKNDSSFVEAYTQAYKNIMDQGVEKCVIAINRNQENNN